MSKTRRTAWFAPIELASDRFVQLIAVLAPVSPGFFSECACMGMPSFLISISSCEFILSKLQEVMQTGSIATVTLIKFSPPGTP